MIFFQADTNGISNNNIRELFARITILFAITNDEF